MSKVVITDTYLTNIANAIRGKNGSSDTYTPSEMASAITNIPSSTESVYEVDSIEEMEELTNVSENDYCVVMNKALPVGYTQLEYIEGTGTQYIDTGVIPNNNTGFEVDGYAINECAIMGANDSNAPLNFNFMNIGDTSYRFQRYGSNSTNAYVLVDKTTYPRNTRYVWKMLKNKIYADNALLATFTNYTLPSTTKTIYLFGVNGASNIALGSKRIYNTKIYNDDTLIRNFIPTKRTSDNEVGMYDLVNNVFYTNIGTGTFIAGSAIEQLYYSIYQYRSSTWVQVGEEYLYPSTTVTPTTSQQTVPIPENYMGLKEVIVSAVTSNIDANIQASNIKKDITILGVTGTLEGGSDLDWSEIGYTDEPISIKDSFDYAKYIYNNWDKTTNFNGNRRLVFFPLMDMSDMTISFSGLFSNCTALLYVPSIDTSSATNVSQMFSSCYALNQLDELDLSSATNLNAMFSSCYSIINLGGFKDLGKAYSTTQSTDYSRYRLVLQDATLLTHDSLMNIINKVYDIGAKGCNAQTLILGATNLAKLTVQEIAIATNKGWTVS